MHEPMDKRRGVTWVGPQPARRMNERQAPAGTLCGSHSAQELVTINALLAHGKR